MRDVSLHINLVSEAAMNQVAFGLVAFVQNMFDKSCFTSTLPDIVLTQIIKSDNYLTADFIIGYHDMDAFSYFTIKNLFLQAGNSQNNTL